MRVCQRCGLSMGDSATFCAVCGARSDGTSPPSLARACAACGHPGPLATVEGHLLCGRCRETLDLLVAEPGTGFSITPITTELERRRTDAQTVRAVYSAFIDEDTCEACAAMDGKTTTERAEAAAWCPNPACTSDEECRCTQIYELTGLYPDNVAPFLAYVAESRLPITARAVEGYHEAREAAEREEFRRWSGAVEPMHRANRCEKADPDEAVALYRQAIVNLLDYADDPLDNWEIRRSLLYAFDRVSILLKRRGLKTEALEETESAASLGLLDGQEDGTKGHRDALRKRLESLRRAVAKQ